MMLATIACARAFSAGGKYRAAYSLPDREAERVVGGADRALPAVALLLARRQHRAEERERLAVESAAAARATRDWIAWKVR